MTMDNYLSRYIESTISKKMKSSGVVLVEGPKFCGKTTTSALFAKIEIRLTQKRRYRLLVLSLTMFLLENVQGL